MQLALLVLAVITVAANAVSKNSDTFNRDVVNLHSSVQGDSIVRVSIKSSVDLNESEPIAASSNNFQYPGSVLINSKNGIDVYETSDDPKVVTDWYKEKIRGDGYDVKNFVTTTVNGVVENKLNANDGDKEVSIKITNPVNGKTNIQVLQ